MKWNDKKEIVLHLNYGEASIWFVDCHKCSSCSETGEDGKSHLNKQMKLTEASIELNFYKIFVVHSKKTTKSNFGWVGGSLWEFWFGSIKQNIIRTIKQPSNKYIIVFLWWQRPPIVYFFWLASLAQSICIVYCGIMTR